jgi:hypothetical protein
MTNDLPPIDFALSPEDKAKAAAARVHLERWRIERNRRDDAREREPEDDAP